MLLDLIVPAFSRAWKSGAKLGFWLMTVTDPGWNGSIMRIDSSMFGASGMSLPTPGLTRSPRRTA